MNTAHTGKCTKQFSFSSVGGRWFFAGGQGLWGNQHFFPPLFCFKQVTVSPGPLGESEEGHPWQGRGSRNQVFEAESLWRSESKSLSARFLSDKDSFSPTALSDGCKIGTSALEGGEKCLGVETELRKG